MIKPRIALQYKDYAAQSLSFALMKTRLTLKR